MSCDLNRRIERRTLVKQGKSETPHKSCRPTNKFCEGGHSFDDLFAVSHSTDNITQVLDIDGGDGRLQRITYMYFMSAPYA